MNHGEEVRGGLFVATGDGAETFDVMEEAFNLASKSIETTAFSSPVVFARGMHCNYRFHSAGADRVDDAVGIVACVGDQGFAGRMLNELLRCGRVMLLDLESG